MSLVQQSIGMHIRMLLLRQSTPTEPAFIYRTNAILHQSLTFQPSGDNTSAMSSHEYYPETRAVSNSDYLRIVRVNTHSKR